MNRAICQIWVVAAAAVMAGGGAARAQDESYHPGSGKGKQKDKPGEKKTLHEEGKELFGGGKEKPGSASEGMWAIVINAFRGDDQGAAAKAGLETVRSQTRLADAYIEKRGDATVILYGRYADPASKEAKADLDKVHGVEVLIGGEMKKVFLSAFLAPPAELHGSKPEYDLRNAKKLNGDWALYTLQVGVYSREDKKPPSPADLAEFRKMAEAAVAKLRSEGEQAFYYHGPSRSMVTIGLWGVDDWDEALRVDKNPALHTLRQRFPNNLQNGMGIKERKRMTDPTTGKQVVKEWLQPSSLVAVPKD